MAFDIAGARAAGYSDDEIADYIASDKSVSFDVAGAKDAGYSSTEIIGFISQDKKQSSSVLRRAGDVGISALKGAIAVPEAAVGLADIVTGGRAGKLAEDAGFRPKEAKAILDEQLSPKQKAANKEVSDAKGFTGTIGAALENPSVIAHSAIESLPMMGAGGVVGRGVMAAGSKVAPWAAGAIGEGVVGAGSAAEKIRQKTNDGLLTAGQAGAAVGTGIGTAAFGAAGGRIAQRFGIADVDSMLAGGAAQMTQKGVARRIVEGGISEGVFEELPQSIQEQVWQNAALGKPLTEGVAESAAMGLVTGAAMGGAANGVTRSKTAPQPEQPAATIADIGAATTAPDAIEAFIKSVNATDDINAVAPQTDIQPIPAAPVEAAPAVLRERDFVPPASGNFGSVNELADLVKTERADVETRRAGLLESDLAAKTAEVDAQVAFNREQQAKQNRMSVLDGVIGSEAALTMQSEQLAQAFSDTLKSQGYANIIPTAQETARIMRGTMARDAMLEQEQPIIEPSQPNEMPVDLVPERAPKQIATDPLGRVKQLVSNGYKLEGKQLQGPSGERVNLNRSELLFVKSQRKGLSNDRNAAADAVSNRDVGSGRTESADTVLRSAETGSSADAQLDQSEEARAQEPATAVPANVPGADISVDRQPALSARAQKRADTLAALESKTSKELRNQSAKEKRQYVKTAIADILQTRDAATRQKKSAAQRKVYAKSNRIDPDRDGMAKAIAKLGGVNPAGRFRLAPEELAIRGHGVQRVFHAKGRTLDEIGSALAELGYVQTDENGKYDQQDFEDKLASVAGGEEILTPQGMMIRAEEERAMAMEETGAQSAEDYDAIESYLDDASDEVQAFIDAAFDAPISQEALTDEELDRWFGAEAERETASTGVPESDTGRQAPSGDQGNQAPAETGTRDEVDFALQAESRDEANARMESELAAQKQEIAELRQQMEQDRAEREQKEIDARQQASADNFRLGQSADDAITGQDDMFGNVDFASDTITIDGVERSRLNSEGKTIAYTSAGLRAFWEFYGDGPLDEDGRPVVLDGKYVNEMGVEKSVDNIGTYRRDDPRLNYAKGNDTKPQTFDHELVADIRAGASVDEVLAKIEANSQREEYRQLAAHLRTLGLKTKLEYGRQKAGMRFPNISSDLVAAGYSAKKNIAYLFQSGNAEANVLHELIHAASINALAGGGKSATQMKLLFQYAKNRDGLKNEYGMSNVEEFIAEAFSNPDFQEALSKIKAPQSSQTLWQKFVEVVRSLLRIPNVSATLLDKVLQTGYAVMEANQIEVSNEIDILHGNVKKALPEETGLQANQRKIQDKFNRFKIVQDWLKSNGVNLSEKADVYQAEATMHGRISTRKEDFRERLVRPLIEKTQQAGVSMEQVADYLKFQHAPEANVRAREVNRNPEATAFGVTDADARKGMAELVKANKAIPDIANEWRQITEQTKKTILDGDIITREMTDAWESAYSLYIPVKGDETAQGVGKGLSVNGKQKGRTGHGLRDEAIIENILRDYERAVSLDEKNRVGHSLLQFALEVGDDSIVSVAKPEKRKVLRNESAFVVSYDGNPIGIFKSKEDAQAYSNQEAARQKDDKSKYSISRSTDARVVMMASPMLADNEVTVYAHGHAIRVQLNDEILARAYTNMGVENVNVILQGAREINSWLSKAYTGYNPEFAISNPIRDFTAGVINLTGDYGIGMTGKIVANYGKAVKELVKARKDPRLSKIVTEYRAAGGSTGAAYLSDLERIGSDVMSAYNEYAGAVNTYQRVYAEQIEKGKGEAKAHSIALLKAGAAGFKNIPVIGHFLNAMEKVNAVTENALRVATFMTLRENGYSAGKAAMAAKDSTVNFNRKGELTNQAGALYLFFNPNVQGTARLLQTLGTSEYKNQARVLTGMMAVLAYTMAEMARGGGDDDEQEWKKIPGHVKDRNIVFKFGETQFMLPIPYGYGVFYGMGNALSDYLHGESGAKIGIRMASSVMENFSPVGNPLPDGKFSPFQLLPTIPKMGLAPTVNENNFGSNITPKRFSDSKPDSQLMYRNTKGTMYDKAASGLNELTGGNKFKPGLVDVSPETLKYWVTSITGGTGKFASDTLNLPVIMAQGASPELNELPVIRKFVRESGITDSRQAFFTAAAEAKQAATAFNDAMKAQDRMAAQKIMQDERPLIRLADFAKSTEQAVKAKRDAIDKIRQDESMKLSEKRLKIKELEVQEQKIYDRYMKTFDRQTKKD